MPGVVRRTETRERSAGAGAGAGAGVLLSPLGYAPLFSFAYRWRSPFDSSDGCVVLGEVERSSLVAGFQRHFQGARLGPQILGLSVLQA